jgi:hypothetical protein
MVHVSVHEIGWEEAMNRQTILTAVACATLCSAVVMGSIDAAAQQRQRVSFKSTPENTKYTQQHVIEVGDVPNHQVRVYEIHRTYPGNPPVINGEKLKEQWTRATSDYTDNSGTGVTYATYVFENGDKFFVTTSLIAQSEGGGKLTATTVGTIMGGTGKFAGIQGKTLGVAHADPKAGVNENQTMVEFWFTK